MYLNIFWCGQSKRTKYISSVLENVKWKFYEAERWKKKTNSMNELNKPGEAEVKYIWRLTWSKLFWYSRLKNIYINMGKKKLLFHFRWWPCLSTTSYPMFVFLLSLILLVMPSIYISSLGRLLVTFLCPFLCNICSYIQIFQAFLWEDISLSYASFYFSLITLIFVCHADRLLPLCYGLF